MTKEDAYNKATLENLSNSNGTRKDIIYAAMDIWAKEIALAFYEKEESVEPHWMEGNFDTFIKNYNLNK